MSSSMMDCERTGTAEAAEFEKTLCSSELTVPASVVRLDDGVRMVLASLQQGESDSCILALLESRHNIAHRRHSSIEALDKEDLLHDQLDSVCSTGNTDQEGEGRL